MTISVFELFSVGIGPSSSHTVGPMRAAVRFLELLESSDSFHTVQRVQVDLFGSLAATGKGHGSDRAVLLGLEGSLPESVDVGTIPVRIDEIRATDRVLLGGVRSIRFTEETDLVFHRNERLPGHPNAIRFTAYDGTALEICGATFFSIGGGFIVEEGRPTPLQALPPNVFSTASELLNLCRTKNAPISVVVLENEMASRSKEEVQTRLLEIWTAMRECVERGLRAEGVLPGWLKVPRRARRLYDQLKGCSGLEFQFGTMSWLNVFALAVSEENAAGGRVVTAPTNGAAGIIPAVLCYYMTFVSGADDAAVITFLLTAGAIASLCKEAASISGAEVGCQGEVGSACAMAAAGLCEVLGGSPAQVENAAEIAIEHHLGLTCDPVGGFVQVPCIERNSIAAVTAVNAANMALAGDGAHLVSLDQALATMRQTGEDMHSKYKETSRGGLAVNVTEC